MNKVDRRHILRGGLALGAGLALTPLSRVAAALPFVDVLSFQDFRDPVNHLDQWHKKTGKPVLLADAARMKWQTVPGETTRNEGGWYAETVAQLITRSNRMKAAGLAIALMSLSVSLFCPAASAEDEKRNTAAKLTQAEIMLQRIGKGINVDVSQLEGGSPVKVLYDPAQYDTLKAAGFQSVRFFVGAGIDPAIYKTRIKDALDRDLAVRGWHRNREGAIGRRLRPK